jgi:DNA-binding transcriptional LysR family regulator
MNQLRYMSVFAHIVEQGSITAAAEHLGLSKSVVSQHLKGLEEELGVVLLKRTTRKQSLTTAGQAFYERCREMNDVARTAWQQARDTLEEPQGRVRITAPDALMGALVVPALAAVIKRYPGIAIELISNDLPLAIAAGDIDLAIRVGASESSLLKQRRIGAFRDVLCSHVNLGEDVSESTLYIANDWQGTDIRHRFCHRHRQESFEFAPTRLCRVDSFNTSLALIRQAVGVGLIPEFLLQPSETALRNVFPELELPENPVYALHPYDRFLPLGVTACLQAIEAQLRRTI